MIVYRHTLQSNETSRFYQSKQEVMVAFRRTEKLTIASRVESLEIPNSKECLVEALNLALAHPSNWEGTVIAKTKEPR